MDQHTGNILAVLDQTVQNTLAYFEGSGLASGVRIGNWGIREMLCHLIFWHEATIEGINSVSLGDAPCRLDAHADVLNDRALIKHQGISIAHLVTRLRELQQQLLKAADNISNLDATVMVRVDGTRISCLQRLEMINSHWTKHMAEFQTA